MLAVGEGVWVAFKHDSVLRLFNGSSFTHMQDLDVAPSIHKIVGMWLTDTLMQNLVTSLDSAVNIA